MFITVDEFENFRLRQALLSLCCSIGTKLSSASLQMTILSTEFISILPAAGWFVTFLLKIELHDHLQGKKIVK